jgi:HlyD family secretion protein
LSQAQAGVALAQSKLRYAHIFAPVGGTLISRNVERGDVVQPGKVLMVLSPEGATQLVVQIDEKHLRQLQVGQSAKVSADAFSNEQFDAKVNFINPGVDPQRGSVTVKLSVQNQPTYLQQDMTVSLNIEVAKIEQALLIPTGSVHDIEKSPWVQTVVNNRIVNQPIKLGLRGASYSQVLEGLSVGNLILKDTFVLTENTRVRSKLESDKE